MAIFKEFTGIDHPAVAADDVDKLAEWYCDVLGFKKKFRHDKPIWIVEAPDGTYVEIMPKDSVQTIDLRYSLGVTVQEIVLIDLDYLLDDDRLTIRGK